MKFKYYIPEEYEVDLKKFLGTSQNAQPQWWKRLTPFVKNHITRASVLTDMWDYVMSDQAETLRSAKSCPGLSQYFKQSCPIYFPTQLLLETFSNGDYRWKSADDTIEVSHHTSDQASSLLDSNNLIVLKFEIPLYFRFDISSSLCYTDPILYNGKTTPYTVSPGIQALEKNHLSVINVITFFPKQDAKYVFDAGTVIAGLQFGAPVTQFVAEKMSTDYRSLTLFKKKPRIV